MILSLEGEGDGVERRELNFAELEALPGQVAQRSVLFQGREVRGVLAASLLALVGDAGPFVTFYSADGYSTTLSRAAAAEAVLVIAIGDQPLSAGRGGPVRLVVGGDSYRACLKHVVCVRVSARAAPERLPSCTHHSHRAA